MSDHDYGECAGFHGFLLCGGHKECIGFTSIFMRYWGDGAASWPTKLSERRGGGEGERPHWRRPSNSAVGGGARLTPDRSQSGQVPGALLEEQPAGCR